MCLIVLFTCIVCSIAIDLPNFMPRCYVDDPHISECISKAAKDMRPYLKNGIKEIAIPNFHPVVLSDFSVNHNSADAKFKADGIKFSIYGMHLYNVADIHFCPKSVKLNGKLIFGNLFIFSEYFMDGHMIELPILGSGYFRGEASPGNITFDIKGEVVKVSGVEYLKLKGVKLQFEMSDLLMHFEGLVNENGPWGNTNEVLKQNSKLAAKVIGPVFQKIFQVFVEKYLNWFLKKISYSKLFPKSEATRKLLN